jgi:hypothetical protein
MPWSYTVNTGANKGKDGTYGKRYKSLRKRWVSYIKGPYKKRYEKQSIYSTRFGFLDLYSGEEQKGLICPSGYNIRQCFGAMAKLWYRYSKHVKMKILKVSRSMLKLSKMSRKTWISRLRHSHIWDYTVMS